MDFREKNVSCQTARETDMVNYLSALGVLPLKIRNNDYWYLSPLRDEHTASFKINRKLNRWYDHGLGEGGNLIDFAVLYHQCTVAEFLQLLKGEFYAHPHTGDPAIRAMENTGNKLVIVAERPLASFALLRYLQERRIPIEIAQLYSVEVDFSLNNKTYYGIGFKNDAGGYEVRNAYFKVSSSPKEITTFNNGTKEVHVFEGFTDFLSFAALHKNHPLGWCDYVILNSVSFFEKARPFMEKHDTIRLYLDRDTTRQDFTRYALSLSNCYQDESAMYKNHKDLNDWVINFGKALKV